MGTKRLSRIFYLGITMYYLYKKDYTYTNYLLTDNTKSYYTNFDGVALAITNFDKISWPYELSKPTDCDNFIAKFVNYDDLLKNYPELFI